MPDVHDQVTRSKNMAAIKSRNTKPELQIRKLLFKKGYRFSLHSKLPGKPDLFLKKYNSVIFINGCFWHGHNCHFFKMPQTRQDFWKTKISKNKENDQKVADKLEALGHRSLIIWECAVKGREKIAEEQLITLIEKFLNSSDMYMEIKGNKNIR